MAPKLKTSRGEEAVISAATADQNGTIVPAVAVPFKQGYTYPVFIAMVVVAVYFLGHSSTSSAQTVSGICRYIFTPEVRPYCDVSFDWLSSIAVVGLDVAYILYAYGILTNHHIVLAEHKVKRAALLVLFFLAAGLRTWAVHESIVHTCGQTRSTIGRTDFILSYALYQGAYIAIMTIGRQITMA